jgi:hypothetical protein
LEKRGVEGATYEEADGTAAAVRYDEERKGARGGGGEKGSVASGREQYL